ncbi:hypothetical protein BKA70DRAFT_7937 [Coprinopsis sp. MPI-PUGE-AT-0042]|nr:hypothetical protein BKA70DRAFT_7937 [Coprinopsis sp. MPI-PUGE-AT-0042]
MSGYAPVERRCLSLNDNAVRTHGSHTIHLDSPSVVQCSAREEDLTTPCWELAQITEQDKQADSGHRCPAHQEQYRQSYGRYRAAKEKVKERRGMMPTMVEIAGMTDPFVVVEKQKGVELYLDALEDERAGRKLHSIRFFNSQMDEGHTERYGNVEREIRRAKELLVHLVGQNQSLGFPMRRNVTVQHTTHSPHAAPLTQEVVGESYPRTNDPVNLTNCGSRDALSTINLNATRRQIPEHGADP